jgi:hypothetical protein
MIDMSNAPDSSRDTGPLAGGRFEVAHGITPENDVEAHVLADERWQRGVIWGVPRPGHPEGQVINHVRDVLANVDAMSVGERMRERLRLIALLHDACKAFVRPGRPASGANHHGMLARHLAERFTDDPDVLDVIELHDEAYACWRQLDRGRADAAYARAQALLERIGHCLDLYLAFYRADSMTIGKDRDPLDWFETFVG